MFVEVESAKFGTMKAKKLEPGAESAQGTSKHHHRLKQKRASRSRSHGLRGIDSESHLVKCSRTKKKRVCREDDSSQGTSKRHRLKQKRASSKQGGTDASKEGSRQHIFELYEGEEENMVCLPEASRAAEQPNKRSFTLLGMKRNSTTTPRSAAVKERIFLSRAEMALKFYKNSQDDEFEILKVLDCNGSTIRHPNYNISKLWLHISFTAKSKNSDSPKLFFGELYRDDYTMEYHAVYCSTFEPNDDPGFKHGCVFCPPEQKHHPSEGFLAGRPPWFVPKMRLWGGPM